MQELLQESWRRGAQSEGGKEGGQVEERKVKKGGQEKVEVADASMKGFASSTLEDVLGPRLEGVPESSRSRDLNEMARRCTKLVERIQLKEDQQQRVGQWGRLRWRPILDKWLDTNNNIWYRQDNFYYLIIWYLISCTFWVICVYDSMYMNGISYVTWKYSCWSNLAELDCTL